MILPGPTLQSGPGLIYVIRNTAFSHLRRNVTQRFFQIRKQNPQKKTGRAKVVGPRALYLLSLHRNNAKI
jgi:hypothetical protein